PSAPTNLTATSANATTISLSWDASVDNVGVLGYRIYCNGVAIDTEVHTTYLHTNIANYGNNTYTVAAYDATGNVSPMSNPVTQTPVDNIAPTVPTNFAGVAQT